MEYSIEGGTYLLHTDEEGLDTYVYRFSNKAGDHAIVFIAAGEPAIGDKIVNGIHVPLLDWKINPDTSKWNEYYSIKFPDIPE